MKGRLLMTASWARRTLAAATSLMASVIFSVFLTVSMRDRSSRRPQRIGERDWGFSGLGRDLGEREWIEGTHVGDDRIEQFMGLDGDKKGK